jgi:hypothetical protein
MLAHFTRTSRDGTALDHLVTILQEGQIRGSARMIPGKRPVVCFFDGPIVGLGRVLRPANRHRYEPFGVAINKRYAFTKGARPVIYIPLAEGKRLLPPDELWRVVALDLEQAPPVDWTFEREWRISGNLEIPAHGTVALVKSWYDVAEVYDRFDGRPPCAGVIPLENLFSSSAS